MFKGFNLTLVVQFFLLVGILILIKKSISSEKKQIEFIKDTKFVYESIHKMIDNQVNFQEKYLEFLKKIIDNQNRLKKSDD